MKSFQVTEGNMQAACEQAVAASLFGFQGAEKARPNPDRSPTKWVRFGEETQRRERAFAEGGRERSGACVDDMRL